MHWGGGWGVVRGVGTAGEKVTWLCKFTADKTKEAKVKEHNSPNKTGSATTKQRKQRHEQT